MNSKIILTTILITTLLIACTQDLRRELTKTCKENSECNSGVCNHQKADFGICASKKCIAGEKTDNNNYYCSSQGRWEKSKITGDNCEQDYECYKQTCFMIPDCKMTNIPRTKVSCQNNLCVSEVIQDECETKGMQRILAKNAFMKNSEGKCFESVAQIELPTVCTQCGNKICEAEESECNCPRDCEQKII